MSSVQTLKIGEAKMTRHDSKAQLETIWEALHIYREYLIPEGNATFDEIWSDVCTAMAWIEEDLLQEDGVDCNE